MKRAAALFLSIILLPVISSCGTTPVTTAQTPSPTDTVLSTPAFTASAVVSTTHTAEASTTMLELSDALLEVELPFEISELGSPYAEDFPITYLSPDGELYLICLDTQLDYHFVSIDSATGKTKYDYTFTELFTAEDLEIVNFMVYESGPIIICSDSIIKFDTTLRVTDRLENLVAYYQETLPGDMFFTTRVIVSEDLRYAIYVSDDYFIAVDLRNDKIIRRYSFKREDMFVSIQAIMFKDNHTLFWAESGEDSLHADDFYYKLDDLSGTGAIKSRMAPKAFRTTMLLTGHSCDALLSDQYPFAKIDKLSHITPPTYSVVLCGTLEAPVAYYGDVDPWQGIPQQLLKIDLSSGQTTALSRSVPGRVSVIAANTTGAALLCVTDEQGVFQQLYITQ